MLAENAGPSISLPQAVLTMLRLTRDELGFRPLAVAGELGSASGAQVAAAPKVASEGVFGNFRVPADGWELEWVVSAPMGVVLPWSSGEASKTGGGTCRGVAVGFALLGSSALLPAGGPAYPSLVSRIWWQALPSWSVLSLAGHPVALMIRNCADIPAIRESTAAKVGKGCQPVLHLSALPCKPCCMHNVPYC
jgi:hypothetical protein